ncbi:MAG: sugar phosphate isomerase/epimerase [Cyclobacteriaceae bacterium]
MMKTRREFIKQASLAASATVLLPSCVASSDKNMLPKIGVQLYTVRNEMDADALGTLKKVADIGYKKIEAASYIDGKGYGYAASELKTILGDLDLQMISGHAGLDIFRNQFDQYLDFMAEVGQEYAVLPWLPTEDRSAIDQFKEYAALLNTSGEKAQKMGLKVCYHNHDFEFIPIDGQLPMDILLTETDPNLVQFELDLYWISKVNLKPADFFMQNEGRVPLWHVKDMANTPEQGFAEVGTGTIDFPSIFAKKDVSGMKHFFVEQDKSDNPLKSIETSYRNLTEKILV